MVVTHLGYELALFLGKMGVPSGDSVQKGKFPEEKHPIEHPRDVFTYTSSPPRCISILTPRAFRGNGRHQALKTPMLSGAQSSLRIAVNRIWFEVAEMDDIEIDSKYLNANIWSLTMIISWHKPRGRICNGRPARNAAIVLCSTNGWFSVCS